MKMRKFETIIITKEAWMFLQNWERERRGGKKASAEFLEKVWKNACRNNGANPATHPIGEDEIRIDNECCGRAFETVKSALTENGFGYRQDGFVAEGFNV